MSEKPLISPTQLAFKSPAAFFAFGLGSGLPKKAPGTFGTIGAIPFLFALVLLPWPAYLLVLALSFVVGIYLCQKTSDLMGVHDHGSIVWDEFVGLWITFFLIPLSWQTILAGFILFRVFDILKPFPIGWLDKRVHGGFGIMIDDVLAGIFAWVCLYPLVYFQLLI